MNLSAVVLQQQYSAQQAELMTPIAIINHTKASIIWQSVPLTSPPPKKLTHSVVTLVESSFGSAGSLLFVVNTLGLLVGGEVGIDVVFSLFVGLTVGIFVGIIVGDKVDMPHDTIIDVRFVLLLQSPELIICSDNKCSQFVSEINKRFCYTFCFKMEHK